MDVVWVALGAGAGALAVWLTAKEAARRRGRFPRYEVWAWAAYLAGAALIYGTFDMPPFGTYDAPIHHHPLVETYIHGAHDDFHIPNIVTVVLGSYRGYDTLGETAVIFTAGVGVLLLLSGRRRKPEDEAAEAVGDEAA